MLSHTRAIVAAAAHAFMTGRKVAGVYDHAQDRDLQIAAEARGDQLQAFDGDRAVRFGGNLPELYDSGDQTFISMAIEGVTATGYDRGTSSYYSLTVSGEMVQLYDYSAGAWFAFSIQA